MSIVDMTAGKTQYSDSVIALIQHLISPRAIGRSSSDSVAVKDQDPDPQEK